MYSKKLLTKYISERLKQKDWSHYQLARELGISQSNFSRALESEQHNFTLMQFARITELLELTPEQVYHILTGKKAKEATTQLVASSALSIVDRILKNDG